MIRLTVKVSPGASRNEVTGYVNDTLHVKIAAAPEKGKANRELAAFLSDRLGIRKSAVTVLRGVTSHTKIIGIEGYNGPDIIERLLK
jgi:uncharacterized protein